jgi:murein DD-endopeptidase MepM/ murein hydrolase activator NlpD
VLRGGKVAEAEVAAVVVRAASVFDLRKIRTAQPYRLEQADDGLLRRFEYEIDSDRLLRVTRSPSEAGFVAEVLPIAKTRALVTVGGRIDRGTSSLFAAMDAAGEAIDLSINLADIFSGEIDFSTDVQPGDRFELLVEKQYRDDHVFAGYGPILAAEFDNAGRRFRAVRFTPPGGAPGYYDDRGASMRRFFLHSPLKFQPVVTSGFSRSRLHPILREYRPHLGVDYRAPIGSAVIAVADGVVVEAGMSGGAGRMVHVRHVNGFESEYLHLSTLTVRAGMHVRQGDLIGRVGMSGLATGPHLDYRLKKNGAFINPLTAQRAMPPADPIPAAQRAAFSDVRDHVFAELAAPPAPRPAVSAAASQQ